MSNLVDVVDWGNPGRYKLIGESIKNTGFCVLKNHPISINLINDVYSSWKGFFNSSIKFDYKFNPKTQSGYFPIDMAEKAQGSNARDFKEYFQLFRFTFGELPPGEVVDITKHYFNYVNSFALDVLLDIEKQIPTSISLKMNDTLTNMCTNSDQSMLRILHYPSFDKIENLPKYRAAPHTDINMITILPCATSKGLQLKTTSGEWIDIPYDTNYVVINSGDMMNCCTYGYYPSAFHRVINPINDSNIENRFSVPFFLHPNSDAILAKDIKANEFLYQRLIELGVIEK